MSEMINRGVEALKRLPVRDREAPGSELDELRLREAVRAVIQSMREPTQEMLAAAYGNAGEENGSDAPARLTWDSMIAAALK